MLSLIARVVAAAGLAAAAYAAVPAAPAAASACPSADGVTVVVDFHELGGGVQTACEPDGAGVPASQLFPRAGFALEYVQRQPGFVCRVSGKPADNPCVSTPPADAYWGLWWSDGRSGRWTYSSAGASGLTVPDGGYVAFSWNGSDGNVPPGTSPAVHPAPTPTPTQQPSSAHPTQHSSSQPFAQPSPQQSAAAPDASGSASPSDGPTKDGKQAARKKRSGGASPTPSAPGPASPTEEATDATVQPASADRPDAGDGGLPSWVAPVVVVVLFGAAGGVALVRRRRSGAV